MNRADKRRVNKIVEREQRAIEQFVRSEYWRLAALKDGRFAYSRAPLNAGREAEATKEPA